MKIFVVGAKSHARICRRILQAEPYVGVLHEFPSVYDGDETTTHPWPDCGLWHEWEQAVSSFRRTGCTHFIVAIGSNGKRRAVLSEQLISLGLEPVSIIHQTAHIGEETKIGRGVQILANVNIGDEVTIGDWCMMHATSSVEHESVVGNGVTIMAGASLMGEVTVKDYAIIGGHATVMKSMIGEGAIVGAGATVVKDVLRGMTVVGPAASELKPRLALVDKHTSA
jgi:sugar O-acyltransferase (sialic acid O-acetyltransferase NeuD family)